MFSQILPKFITEKRNIVRLIVLTALFALVFINIYKPFSSSSWYNVSEFKFFVFSSLIILTGVLVVVISRIIMYHHAKKSDITYGQYAGWILLEIFFMSLLYTVYTITLNPERDWLEVFKGSSINTSLVLLLPYFSIHLYLSYQDKNKKLKQLAAVGEEKASKQQFVAFYDERNELRITIKKQHLLYIESADNYVFIWYMNKGNLAKFMLRNSLKTIEQNLEGTSILRCHRSYIANFELVKVIRRQKEGIYLEFGIDKVPDIPISKSYSEKVNHWFMTYSA